MERKNYNYESPQIKVVTMNDEILGEVIPYSDTPGDPDAKELVTDDDEDMPSHNNIWED